VPVNAEGFDTNSEAWRFECEARVVAGLPNEQARTNYFNGCLVKRGERGKEGVKRLRAFEIMDERAKRTGVQT
jgi:hypothetical protein